MRRRMLTILGLCLLCAVLASALASLTGCEKESDGGSGGGTYYLYLGSSMGGFDMTNSIKLSGGKFTMTTAAGDVNGTCEINGSEIRLLTDGKEWYTGTIANGKITLEKMYGVNMPTELEYYLDGKLPESNSGTNGRGEASMVQSNAAPATSYAERWPTQGAADDQGDPGD